MKSIHLKINKIIFGIIAVLVVFLLSSQIKTLANKVYYGYQEVCYTDCVKTDITETVEYQDNIWNVLGSNYSHLVLDYTRLFSSQGAMRLSAIYNDKNGNNVELYGMSFDIDPEDIKWPFIGAAEIIFENGRIYMIGSKVILKSNASTFSDKLSRAAYILSLTAREHDDELQPVELLDGTKKFKGRNVD